MFVTSFLEQVDIHLVADYKLMAAVADAYARCVHLVAVAYVHTVEAAADEHRHGVCRAVRHAAVHYFLVVGVYQAA